MLYPDIDIITKVNGTTLQSVTYKYHPRTRHTPYYPIFVPHNHKEQSLTVLNRVGSILVL
jgi:hypothetical protein